MRSEGFAFRAGPAGGSDTGEFVGELCSFLAKHVQIVDQARMSPRHI